jgi:putative transposase
VDGDIRLSKAGEIVWEVWQSLTDRYTGIELDAAAVMPNHFHGIIWIAVGAIHELPLQKNRRQMLLPKVIGYFKMNAAKRINTLRGTTGQPVWQRNYYERVVRNDCELEATRAYIRANPQNWEDD